MIYVSPGDPVEGDKFLDVSKSIFPDATLSVGWTTGSQVSRVF